MLKSCGFLLWIQYLRWLEGRSARKGEIASRWFDSILSPAICLSFNVLSTGFMVMSMVSRIIMNEFTKEELEMRANKMSFLLGLCTGSLTELIGDENIPEFQKQKLKDLLSRIYPYIDELYYKDKIIE